MKNHPYLRAYLAGVALPTLFFPFALVPVLIARLVYNVPFQIERVVIFPLALVPTLWGLWNMLYLSLLPRRHLPIGFHGAVLPLLLVPLGFAIGRHLGFLPALPGPLPVIVTALCIFCVYYLLWKYVVSCLNGLLGIS